MEKASGSYFSKLTGAADKNADKGDGNGQTVTIQPTEHELAHFLCLVPILLLRLMNLRMIQKLELAGPKVKS
jgi:hypothetical protein